MKVERHRDYYALPFKDGGPARSQEDLESLLAEAIHGGWHSATGTGCVFRARISLNTQCESARHCGSPTQLGTHRHGEQSANTAEGVPDPA
eukprot:6171937-Pleurochrysis_carterae.AAC.2